MPVFFKITSDGKLVRVAKTLVKQKIDEKEFFKKSRYITLEQFLTSFNKAGANKLHQLIDRTQQIDKLQLSKFGSLSVAESGEGRNATYYYIGNRIFVDGESVEGIDGLKSEGIEWGEVFYGKEFMKQNLSKLEEKEIYYYSHNTQISKEEYEKLMAEKDRLTTIVNVEKFLKIYGIREEGKRR